MKTKALEVNTEKINTFLLSAIIFLLPFEFYPYTTIGSLTLKPIHVLLVIFVMFNIPNLLNNYKKSLSYPWIFITLFLVIATLTTLLNPSLSGFKRILLYSFEFTLAFTISLVLKKNSLNWLIHSVLISSVMVASFAIFQFIADTLGVSSAYTLLQPRYIKGALDFTRVHGFSFEPLFFAWIMTLGLIVSLICFYFYKKPIYAVSSLIILISILLSFSKIAFTILALLVVVLTITSIVQKDHKFTVVMVGVFSLLMLAASVFTVKFGLAKVQHLSLPSTSTSSSSRVKSYVETTKVIINYPVGVGSGQIEKVIASKYSLSQLVESGNTKTNNLLLEIIAENGILAALSLFAFFSCILFYFIQSVKQPITTAQKIWMYSGMLFLLSSLIFWQVVGNLATTSVWIVIGIFLAVNIETKNRHSINQNIMN